MCPTSRNPRHYRGFDERRRYCFESVFNDVALPHTSHEGPSLLHHPPGMNGLIAHVRRIPLFSTCTYGSSLAAIIGLLVDPIHLEIFWLDWNSVPECVVQAPYSQTYVSIGLFDTKTNSFSELALLFANSMCLDKLTISKFEPTRDPLVFISIHPWDHQLIT
ncbi:hypothetical protein IW262DRAFT_115907 [Armillaria fumosa]|nr:hypothetical protein IW262DRAFT_115907 [Armillaria fumosa]